MRARSLRRGTLPRPSSGPWSLLWASNMRRIGCSSLLSVKYRPYQERLSLTNFLRRRLLARCSPPGVLRGWAGKRFPGKECVEGERRKVRTRPGIPDGSASSNPVAPILRPRPGHGRPSGPEEHPSSRPLCPQARLRCSVPPPPPGHRPSPSKRPYRRPLRPPPWR